MRYDKLSRSQLILYVWTQWGSCTSHVFPNVSLDTAALINVIYNLH